MNQTPKFVLIDHSLKKVGGHHFEYAVHLLRAAESAGFQPVLGVHRKFRDRNRLPRSWHVHSLFRYHGYNRYTMGLGHVDHPVNPFRRENSAAQVKVGSNGLKTLRAWWQSQRELWERWRQRTRVADLCDGCTELVRRIGLEPGDQVLFPTVTEFDMVGLAQFLSDVPATRHADWHLQFHDGFLSGREVDYARQSDRIAEVQSHFRELLQTIPAHRLHFHTITPQIAAQYEQLRLVPMGATGEAAAEPVPFEVLRYPVSPTILQRAVSADALQGPLRVFCSSPVRDSASSRFLTGLLSDIGASDTGHRDVQLLVRAKRKRLVPQAPRMPARNTAGPQIIERHGIQVKRVPLALPPAAYVEQVCDANIGLFLYDSRIYSAKCSGMLTEMLSAGVPVIVPAGCWLSEQIAECIYAHVDGLCQTLPVAGQLRGEQLVWTRRFQGDEPRRRDAGLIVGGIDGELAAEFDVPAHTTELVVRFRLGKPVTGLYVRWQCDCLDEQRKPIGRVASVCGFRQQAADTPALLPIPPGTRHLRLRAANEFSDTEIALTRVTLSFLSTAINSPGHCPAGAVGLIAADRTQVPALLRNMIDHYPHFRKTAQEFARSYGRLHDPNSIFSQLLTASRRSSHAA